MTKFMNAKQSSVRILSCVGLAALMSCSSGPSQDTFTSSVDAPDVSEASVVEAATSGENTENADNKNFSYQGDIPNVNSSDNGSAMTQISNSAAEKLTATGLTEGMPYIEARTILIQQGWTPLEQPEPGSYGVEREMYDLGVREVSACSGTGVGYCSFILYKLDSSRPEGHLRLSVATVGGSNVEVSRWESNFLEGPPPLSVNNPPANNSQPVAAQATNAGNDPWVQQRTDIPEHFRGLWNASTDECLVPYSQGRLEVRDDRLRFYETSGSVTEVTSNGEYEITVSADLMSEGTAFTKSFTFRLAADHSSIADMSTGIIRYRCPDI